MKRILKDLKVRGDLYSEMKRCKTRREGRKLAIRYYKEFGILTRQGCKTWLRYIKGWNENN